MLGSVEIAGLDIDGTANERLDNKSRIVQYISRQA